MDQLAGFSVTLQLNKFNQGGDLKIETCNDKDPGW